MPKIKITVVKRLNFDEIHADSDVGCTPDMDPVCEVLEEGQEFVTDLSTVPEGFCGGAFADIFKYMSGLRSGANYAWVKEQGKTLACCSDGFRPVVFRLERIED